MYNYHDHSGVIHVHSTYSDGAKSVPYLINAANRAGCDYLILTDHDTMAAYKMEGQYKNTLFLVGEEITVKQEQGHYLGLNLKKTIPPVYGPQETIEQVNQQGGIGFMAHPDVRKGKLAPVTWADWTVEGFTGIEIWNYHHDWLENIKLKDLFSGLLKPDTFIEGPIPQTVQKWDELLTRKKVVGIGSVDAHDYFMSYQKMFKTIRNHILVPESLTYHPAGFKKNKKLIYQALQKGNCYLSYHYLANAGGFMFSAQNHHQEVIMGEELSLHKGVVVAVSSPRPCQLRIVKNQQCIARKNNTRSLIKKIEQPGAYRAEAYLRLNNYHERPWVFTNPIYLTAN